MRERKRERCRGVGRIILSVSLSALEFNFFKTDEWSSMWDWNFILERHPFLINQIKPLTNDLISQKLLGNNAYAIKRSFYAYG